jgi:tetratricopeptide (TPR) repeat protein
VARLGFKALVFLAVLMRLNNAVRFPSLTGYDSFGHLTYIWYLLKTGSVPFADQGWSFFHPPLYYALAAAIWKPLQAVDPKQVLKVIGVTFSLVGLGSAWIASGVARRYFAHNRLARGAAPLFVLFVPVGIYTAPMLGNEGLNAVLCSGALWLLLHDLDTPTWPRAAALGLLLGAALLTKATAAAIVMAAVLSLAAWGVATRRLWTAAVHLAIVLGAAGLVCGWYYVRNTQHFGTPFVMSRSYLVVAHVENAFPTGQRGPLAYLRFDPRILVSARYMEPPVIDSVWTGAVAGTWFEVVGASFTPRVEHDAAALWTARMLIVLGLIPTGVILLGIFGAARRLVRRGWDATLVVMLSALAAMIGVFIVYTHHVPQFTAVKASYLMPAVVPFGFFFALGLAVVARWRHLLRLVLINCALALALIIPVFTYQLIFAAELDAFYWNALGVTYYLAGFDDSAQEILSAVGHGYHYYAPYENLAAIALDHGRFDEALANLEQATTLVESQTFGVGRERSQLAQLNVAEYASTSAVAYAAAGRVGQAVAAAQRAVDLAPEIPEAHYNLATLVLQGGSPEAGRAEVERALQLDPSFTEAHALLAIAAARQGDCRTAVAELQRAAAVSRPQRAYPWQTGRGDLLDAGLARRRIITLCAAGLNPYSVVAICNVANANEFLLPWLPPAQCDPMERVGLGSP